MKPIWKILWMPWAILLSLAMLAPTPTSAEDKPVKDEDEWKKLVGKWELASLEAGGQKLPDDNKPDIKLVIKAEKAFEVITPDNTVKGPLKIDVKQKPKDMDIEVAEGENQGKVFKAIYDFDGEDLRICVDISGENRPKEFKTEPGTPVVLIVFKRMK